MDLSKFNLSDDAMSAIQAHIDELNNKYQAAKDESIKNRKGKDERISTLQKQLDDVLEKLGLSDIGELENMPDTKGMADAQKQVEAQLKRLTKELETAKNELTDKTKALTSMRTDSALKEAMSQHQFIDDELVGMMVKSRLQLEGDEVLYSGENGAMLNLSDALAGIAKAKPHLLKAPVNGGSGFTGGNGGNSFIGKAVTAEQLSAMSPSEYQQFSTALADGKVQLAT